MRLTVVYWAALGGWLAAASPLRAGPDLGPESNRTYDQFFTEAAARDRVFGPHREWLELRIQVDSTARHELYRATGLAEPDSVVRLAYFRDSAGAPAGAYRVASEIGKYLPFEFLVAVDRAGRVQDIVVLNYRESRGGEVRRERFLQQFRGKDRESPVRLNRDILGIAGATLSAWAVNRGVKKTLWWCDRSGLFGEAP